MKQKGIIYFVLMLMLFSLAGCAGPGSEKKGQTQQEKVDMITVDVGVLRGPSAISIVKMIDENPSFSDRVKINYTVEQSPEVLSSKLLSEEMEFAAIPTNTAAILYNKGVPYQLAAVNTWGVMYLVSSDAAVNSWSDLKGREIGAVSKGAASDVVFKYLLSQNGINPDQDVTLTYSPSPVELAQLVIAGKTKIAALPEPWVSLVLSKNPQAQIKLDLQQEWSKKAGEDVALPQTCLVVNRNFASEYPEFVDAFLREYKSSIIWVNNDNTAAAALLKKHDLGIPADLAQAAIPRCNLQFMNGQRAKPAVDGFLKILLDFSPETTGGKVPDEKFYYQK